MNKKTFTAWNQGMVMFLSGAFLFSYYYFVCIWLEPTKTLTFSVNSVGEANLELIILTIIAILVIIWNFFSILWIKNKTFK